MSERDDIKKLQKELAVVHSTLTTLIVWMAQSSNSPISFAEAEKLIKQLSA